MQISEDTRNVMNYLDEYSGNTLRSAEELSLILNILAGNNSFDLMNELIFVGKSVYNLHSTINKNNPDKGQLTLLESEFNKSFTELTKALNKVLQLTSESDAIEKIGALMNPQNPELIISLAHDLSILKDLQALFKTNRK